MEIKKFNLNSVQQLLMVGFNPSHSIDSRVFLIKSLNGGFMSCWFVITVRERPCEITPALPAPAAVETDFFEMVEFVIRCYWAEPISDETWLSFSTHHEDLTLSQDTQAKPNKFSKVDFCLTWCDQEMNADEKKWRSLTDWIARTVRHCQILIPHDVACCQQSETEKTGDSGWLHCTSLPPRFCFTRSSSDELSYSW